MAWTLQDEQRRQEIAGMVARGELPADALAEDLEDLPDAHDELLAEVGGSQEVHHMQGRNQGIICWTTDTCRQAGRQAGMCILHM